MRADLHVHSTASDGTLTPSELVEVATARQLDVLAIADHDSVEGLTEARTAASHTALKLIPAVELSSVTDSGRDVHILGYFIDPEDESLLLALESLRHARFRRAETMVSVLGAAGYPVPFEEVLAISAGGAVGRSHVARALVSAGHAETVTEAFERFIGRGRPFYVTKDVTSPAEAIARIRDAGGIAVVAHPGVSKVDDLLVGLVEVGLGGIEAYHADHSPEQRARYSELARSLGVLVSGGSDFHGPDAPNAGLGSVRIPDAAIDALLRAGAEL
ncbi:MAG: hypothetical protein CVT67_00420 [Actinobacteria bacterium HGW-Actinobacteria-7]|nr:MAG: hypothetical protein CVT67_00420 [Actinobacteria bacterium HGW-Actinobacteria-7]